MRSQLVLAICRRRNGGTLLRQAGVGDIRDGQDGQGSSVRQAGQGTSGAAKRGRGLLERPGRPGDLANSQEGQKAAGIAMRQQPCRPSNGCLQAIPFNPTQLTCCTDMQRRLGCRPPRPLSKITHTNTPLLLHWLNQTRSLPHLLPPTHNHRKEQDAPGLDLDQQHSPATDGKGIATVSVTLAFPDAITPTSSATDSQS
eukprot:366320-Chlamydomonas_euryale.AAC.17